MGFLVFTYYSVDSSSITDGASMNLHSGFSQDFALPSVWGQVIYMLLVSCLVGSGPATLNAYHVSVVFAMSKLFFLGCYYMSDLV